MVPQGGKPCVPMSVIIRTRAEVKCEGRAGMRGRRHVDTWGEHLGLGEWQVQRPWGRENS